eukprot:1154029-Pelagomonas_calceolata.AAC.2
MKVCRKLVELVELAELVGQLIFVPVIEQLWLRLENARKPQALGGGEQQQLPVKRVCLALVRAARSSQSKKPQRLELMRVVPTLQNLHKRSCLLSPG